VVLITKNPEYALPDSTSMYIYERFSPFFRGSDVFVVDSPGAVCATGAAASVL
jgi:hypothetical protein